jgi:hypothetical protein
MFLSLNRIRFKETCSSKFERDAGGKPRTLFLIPL